MRRLLAHRGVLSLAVSLWLVAGLLAAVPALAVRYVDDSGDNANAPCTQPTSPCKTITFAISVADPNETIRVGAGTYDETITLSGGQSIVEDLSFKPGSSDAPAGGAIVSSNNGSLPAIKVAQSNPAGSTIDGLTIRGLTMPLEIDGGVTVSNNTFDQTTAPSTGQIVNIAGPTGTTAAPILQANTFSDPNHTDDRTGIFIGQNASPQILGNTMSGYLRTLQVDSGGGSSPDSPLIAGNTITGSHDTNTTDGRGITVLDATPTLRDNTLSQPSDGPDAGTSPDGTLGISITDTAAANGFAAGGTLERNRILGTGSGMSVGDESTTTDPAVTMSGDAISGNNLSGLGAAATQAGGAHITSAVNVTVANNTPQDVVVNGAGSSIALDSSIVGNPIATGANTSCTITFSRGPTTGASGCTGFQTAAVPAFAADGYHLLPAGNSALIDTGNPAAPAVGAVDVDGDGRALDGDGDCVARRDMGADERPALSCPSGASPGAGGSPGAGAGQGALAGADKSPVMDSFAFDRAAFPSATAGGSVARARRRTGAKVSYRLSEKATVRFGVDRPGRGRRVKGKCRKPTARNRRSRRCTRFVRLKGGFTHQGAAGRNSFRFTGRLAGKALRPGRYRLVAFPTDAGGKRGKAVALGFRIVP